MNEQFFLKQSVRRIFFMLIVIPCLIQLILINVIKVIEDEILYYLIFLFFTMLYLPYFYWLNLVIGFLYNLSNNHFKLKLINFKISLFLNIIVIFNFVLSSAYVFRFVFHGGRPDMDIILFMVAIQFIGIPSFIYTTYFISKLIVTSDLNRSVRLSDVVGNFVTLLFPPLALWFIQTKIKKIQDKM